MLAWQQRRQLLEQCRLAVIAHQPRIGIDRRECRPIDLHAAPGDHDVRPRVRPPRASHRCPALLIRDGRHGARVDEHEVRWRRGIDQPHPALAQEAGGALHLGLVHLAAEVDDGRRSRHPAHHSIGLVLMRNPMVPTRPAMR